MFLSLSVCVRLVPRLLHLRPIFFFFLFFFFIKLILVFAYFCTRDSGINSMSEKILNFIFFRNMMVPIQSAANLKVYR